MRKLIVAVPFILFAAYATAEPTPTETVPVEPLAVEQTDSKNQVQPLTIVISAARVEQSIENVGSSVTVLEIDKLQRRGVQFMADALAEVPSLVVSSQGPRGSKTQIRVRGNEANHVLVLVDGVRVSNASDGEYDFANMSLDAVEKVEVLLGPQSTLYGSDAIAGVISITTRKGGRGLNGHVQANFGSFNTKSGFAQITDGEQGWHYALTASHYKTDGISAAAENNGNTEKDGYDSEAVHFKGGYDGTDFQTWVALWNAYSRIDFDDQDYSTGLAIDNLTNRQWIKESARTWVLAKPLLNGRFQNQIQLGSIQYDYKSYSGGDYTARTDRDSFTYQGNYKATDTQSIQFGLEQVLENLVLDTPYDFGEKLKNRGLYAQWLTTIGRTDLSIGTRSDKHQEFGQHQTYRATANYHLDDAWRIRAAYGTGFKAPSLIELYKLDWGGNPGLKPEQSSSVEVGTNYKRHNTDASVTVFRQALDNLIRSVGVWPNSQLENVDTALSHGVELLVNQKWNKFDLKATVTKLRSTESVDGVTSKRLRVPDLLGNLETNYFYDHGHVWAKADYRGERRDSNFATYEDVTLQAYWLFEIGTRYELDKNLSLSARIENLTDRDYEEVYSYGTRGRTVTATVDWRF